MSDLSPERIESLWRSAQRGHYADCVHAADEPVCACWTECADGLAETLAALTAAAEREQALREEVDSLNAGIENAVVLHDALEADVARLTRELAVVRDSHRWMTGDRDRAESALAAERQKVTEFLRIAPCFVSARNWRQIEKALKSCGLTPPKTGEPA